MLSFTLFNKLPPEQKLLRFSTLAIAYAGLTAALPVIYFLVRALIDWMYTLLTKENAEVQSQETSETPRSL